MGETFDMVDRIYYTYAYLREDGTPYYIGRGKGKRAFDITHRIAVPPRERILFLKTNLTYAEATRHEVYMIAVLGRKDMGTGILRNLTHGGEGRTGPKSPEEVEKIRKANTGKKLSEETKRKISKTKTGLTGELCPNFGKRHSEETKAKISKSKTGSSHSDEARLKMSAAKKGSKHPMYGKTHTPEVKAKMREFVSLNRWWVNPEGVTRFCSECPGSDWTLGRKLREV